MEKGRKLETQVDALNLISDVGALKEKVVDIEVTDTILVAIQEVFDKPPFPGSFDNLAPLNVTQLIKEGKLIYNPKYPFKTI